TQDEAHYRNKTWATKFYDPSYKSCTQFIADTLRTKYGFEASELGDLVHWADVIDGAQYKDAKTAVELEAPALKLMLVIEASRDRGVMDRIIDGMRREPLERILEDEQVRRAFEPLFERHQKMIEVIRSEGQLEKGVLFFDLSGYDAEGYSKFIPYYLFPDCVYSVGVSLSSSRSKVSVGFNPWSPEPRR